MIIIINGIQLKKNSLVIRASDKIYHYTYSNARKIYLIIKKFSVFLVNASIYVVEDYDNNGENIYHSFGENSKILYLMIDTQNKYAYLDNIIWTMWEKFYI